MKVAITCPNRRPYYFLQLALKRLASRASSPSPDVAETRDQCQDLRITRLKRASAPALESTPFQQLARQCPRRSYCASSSFILANILSTHPPLCTWPSLAFGSPCMILLLNPQTTMKIVLGTVIVGLTSCPTAAEA
ncbi:hypothetical protein TgHK011_002000 [Trichoderma gracile]|nr:hypothetical protein TgHK011_002000 [Trichoderma gracile]